jgi:hypothetical protein
MWMAFKIEKKIARWLDLKVPRQELIVWLSKRRAVGGIWSWLGKYDY